MDPEVFIKTELIPGMVERGDLKLSNETSDGNTNVKRQIKTIKISSLSDDGTFMATICNRVNVILVDHENNNETEYKLIVKVSNLLFIQISFKIIIFFKHM